MENNLSILNAKQNSPIINFYKEKCIFLTGGTGFLGTVSEIVKILNKVARRDENRKNILYGCIKFQFMFKGLIKLKGKLKGLKVWINEDVRNEK